MSFVKESKSSYFFEWQKSKQKTISFFVKKRNKKTTPFRIHNSVFIGLLQFIENLFAILNNNVALAHCVIQGVKTPCCSGYAFPFDAFNFEIISRNENYAFDYNKYFCRNGNNRIVSSLRGFAKNRSNPNLIKFDFYNLVSLINKFYIKWIATPLARNDKFKIGNDNFNYAFSCALKNKFEIISQSDYGFCYKNYFFNLNQVFRNSYDFGRDFDFGRNLNYGFGKDCNCNFKKNCDYGFEGDYNFGFGKNYFGNCNFGFDFWNEIYGIGNNLAGFLFNRKILKTKI